MCTGQHASRMLRILYENQRGLIMKCEWDKQHVYSQCEDVLLCPRCKSMYLHHTDIIVSDRSEDEKWCQETTINTEGTIVNRTPGNYNPSPHRDGLIIKMWCEECDRTSTLKIYQHKGCTYVAWDDAS